MTLPERSPPRKANRVGLYAPFLVVAVIAIVWSAAWFWLAGEVGHRLDQARTPGARYTARWRNRSISGYPFRLDVDFDDAGVGEPSGWAVAVPRLETEAFVFAPDHWVAVAPDGATFTRPTGGSVTVRANVLRLSLSELASRPPRLSVEGRDLAFSTPPGASPFSITSARELHLHTRAGPDDKGAFFFQLVGATARSPGLLDRVADGRPFDVSVDAIYSRAGRLAGLDWASAVRAWSAAGGGITVRHLTIAAGDVVLESNSGTLAVDSHGSLSGELAADFATGPAEAPGKAKQANGRTGTPTVTVLFRGGQVRLGPVPIGPAPRLY